MAASSPIVGAACVRVLNVQGAPAGSPPGAIQTGAPGPSLGSGSCVASTGAGSGAIGTVLYLSFMGFGYWYPGQPRDTTLVQQRATSALTTDCTERRGAPLVALAPLDLITDPRGKTNDAGDDSNASKEPSSLGARGRRAADLRSS